jgi:hypothetical protein
MASGTPSRVAKGLRDYTFMGGAPTQEYLYDIRPYPSSYEAMKFELSWRDNKLKRLKSGGLSAAVGTHE